MQTTETVITSPPRALACAVLAQAFFDLRATAKKQRVSAVNFLTDMRPVSGCRFWAALAGMDAAWIADRARAIMQEAR